MADPAAFLARWSRLKRRARSEARSGSARPQQAEPVPRPIPARDAPPQPAPKPAAELPPIESLGKDSDYTAFMRPDVPDALRNQALRKLWQSDPVFANLDGLVEYGEDFGAAFKLGSAVATVYRVLEGMPGPAEEETAGTAESSADSVAPPSEPRPRECEAAADPASPFRDRKHGVGRQEDIESDGDVELD